MFELNMFKSIIKTNFIKSNPFVFQTIKFVKILSSFQKEWCTLVKKMTFEKNKDCPLSKFECFEHAKTFLCQPLNI
jgi:hypothetical protein